MAASVSGRLLESLSLTRIAAVFVVLLVGSFLVDFALKPRYPKSLPRVGYGESTFATLRNWIGYLMYFGQWVDEGYEKVRRASCGCIPGDPCI